MLLGLCLVGRENIGNDSLQILRNRDIVIIVSFLFFFILKRIAGSSVKAA